MRKFACLLVLVTLLCIGCADTTPLYYTSTFDNVKAEQMLRSGRNKIIVKAVTAEVGSDSVHGCMGEKATLMPATERAAEYIKFVFGYVDGGETSIYYAEEAIPKRIKNDDPALENFSVNQTCTSENSAVFDKVADGEFYVLGRSYQKIYAKKIKVKGGETKEVVLYGEIDYVFGIPLY